MRWASMLDAVSPPSCTQEPTVIRKTRKTHFFFFLKFRETLRIKPLLIHLFSTVQKHWPQPQAAVPAGTSCLLGQLSLGASTWVKGISHSAATGMHSPGKPASCWDKSRWFFFPCTIFQVPWNQSANCGGVELGRNRGKGRGCPVTQREITAHFMWLAILLPLLTLPK